MIPIETTRLTYTEPAWERYVRSMCKARSTPQEIRTAFEKWANLFKNTLEWGSDAESDEKPRGH
jgi:truncated hemoglobin YjbI